MMIFKNRAQAGQLLARQLNYLAGQPVVVFGIPRGGVVVAARVARLLNADLELVAPRRIGHPADPEFAIGAVTEGGEPVWDEVEAAKTDPRWREFRVAAARQEAKRHRLKYLDSARPIDVRGKIAVVVDDGIATGLSMRAAVDEVRRYGPRAVIAAAPVAPAEACADLMRTADEVRVLDIPQRYFSAVRASYEHFPPVTDEEVRGLMDTYRAIEPAEPLDLTSVNAILATVPAFPVTSGALAAQARNLHAAPNVQEFFESIPSETQFSSKADVIRRTEEVEALEQDEAAEPPENLRSYE